jgi:hypothetical protein
LHKDAHHTKTALRNAGGKHITVSERMTVLQIQLAP